MQHQIRFKITSHLNFSKSPSFCKPPLPGDANDYWKHTQEIFFAKFKVALHAAIVSNTWQAPICQPSTPLYPADFDLNPQPYVITRSLFHPVSNVRPWYLLYLDEFDKALPCRGGHGIPHAILLSTPLQPITPCPGDSPHLPGHARANPWPVDMLQRRERNAPVTSSARQDADVCTSRARQSVVAPRHC
jgi:hypothetical protein